MKWLLIIGQAVLAFFGWLKFRAKSYAEKRQQRRKDIDEKVKEAKSAVDDGNASKLSMLIRWLRRQKKRDS